MIAHIATATMKDMNCINHTDADDDGLCDSCEFNIKPEDEPSTEEPENPQPPEETLCDHLCHKDGFLGFIWKIVCFFQKLFGIEPVCECGAAHY